MRYGELGENAATNAARSPASPMHEDERSILLDLGEDLRALLKVRRRFALVRILDRIGSVLEIIREHIVDI